MAVRVLNLVLSKLLAYGLARLQERSTAAGAVAALLGLLHLATSGPVMQSLVDTLATIFGLVAVVIKTRADGQPVFAPTQPVIPPSPPGTTADELDVKENSHHA